MTQTQFNHLFTTNYKALMNFAKRLTRNVADAEDLVQETALKAFRSIHTFRINSSFKSWAFTILKNTFITKYHKNKKRQLINSPIEDLSFAYEKKHALKNRALSNIGLKEIKNCFEDLSLKSRRPFELYIQGYQYNEIADDLDIPVGTVKSRINFARKKLKSALFDRGIIAA